MYRGFKISSISFDDNEMYNAGLNRINQIRSQIQSELETYLSADGTLNGEALEKEWFPLIKADIFISHSHADERLAVSLSAWLFINFGLTAFVDSGVWGQSDILLKKIDNKHCVIKDQNLYDYDKRNVSTSYVHMILGMALAKLIDKTECLFFINSPNSVSPSNAIDKPETHSPWLYYEIGISSLIGKPLREHRHGALLKKARQYSVTNESRVDIKLPLNMKHLTSITGTDLKTWMDSHDERLEGSPHPLDQLYQLFPGKKSENVIG